MEIQEIDICNPPAYSPFNGWLKESSPSMIDVTEESLKEDLWGFGFFWPEVVDQYPTVEDFYARVQDLYSEIRSLKEQYRDRAVEFSGKIERNLEGGVSGSYFALDEEGNRRFVIKPLDEDAGCIHSEYFATPFASSPLRAHLPLYRSPMREVLAYKIAEKIGVSSIIPPTQFALIESDEFHDLSKNVAYSELNRFMELCGESDKEKLCSMQEYVPNSKSLFEAIHELEQAGLSDEEIAQRFDQTDFEEANILLWTTYDTDGHMGNFLVYPKGVDEIGNEILGIKKIDHNLAFPDKNLRLRNNLSYLPNAKRELSETARSKILAIDVDALRELFEQMGLESAVPALKEQIPYLQELAKTEGITIKEINQNMSNIGKKR